jgi:hypothetical protein
MQEGNFLYGRENLNFDIWKKENISFITSTVPSLRRHSRELSVQDDFCKEDSIKEREKNL